MTLAIHNAGAIVAIIEIRDESDSSKGLSRFVS